MLRRFAIALTLEGMQESKNFQSYAIRRENTYKFVLLIDGSLFDS